MYWNAFEIVWLSLIGNYPISGNNNFPGLEKKLLTFSHCGQFLSVADGSAVWVWDCGRLVCLIEDSKPVSSKFRYYHNERRESRELDTSLLRRKTLTLAFQTHIEV
jgi:hypothetical protein